MYIFEDLEIDEAIDVVSSIETGDQLSFMFIKPASEIVGHTSVRSAGRISEYVNVVVPFAAHDFNSPSIQSSRAKRGDLGSARAITDSTVGKNPDPSRYSG